MRMGMFSLGTEQNVLVLAWWCKTVINVCSLSLPLMLSTLSPNCLLCSLPLNNSVPLPSRSLPPSIFLHLPSFSPSASCIPPASSLLFHLTVFRFVLQASELGMTSAFYKYILTTMVRACQFSRFLSPVSSFPHVHPPLLLLLFCPFMSKQRC